MSHDNDDVPERQPEKPATPSVSTIMDNTGPITGPIKRGDVTDETQPVFSGKGTPGNEIIIRDGDDIISKMIVDEDGNWNWKPDTPLGEGDHGLISGGKLDQDRTIELSPEILAQIANAMMPAGATQAFAMPDAPVGWLECDGRALSREEFSTLFSAIGTRWGEGDGKTTFNIPDFRGMFLRGWDNGRGIDADRAFATQQDSENKKHKHEGKTSMDGDHDHTYKRNSVQRGETGAQKYNIYTNAYETINTSRSGIHDHTLNIDNAGGKESRPVNFAVLYCIKT